jgi:hypothetical protein
MFPSFIILENTINHDFNSGNYYCYLLKDPRNKNIFYVGKGRNARIVYHKYEYTSNNHHKNSTIKNILNDSGAFIAEIIYTTSSEKEAYEVEEKLIKKYKEQYNLTNLEETRGSSIQKPARAIHQYNLFGEYIKTFPSYWEAGKSLDMNVLEHKTGTQIMECCRGAVATCGGYYWSYYDQPIFRYRTKTRPIVQCTLGGKFVNRYVSAEEAALALPNGNRHDILKAIKRNGTCKGFKWKYWEFPK